MSCAALLVIIYALAVSGRRSAASRNSKTLSFFSSIGLYTLIVWTAYPM